jgi:hypothetical protein
MKKILGISLTVAALALLVSPAMAADSPQAAPALSTADQAFLASLAAPVETPVAPAPEPAAKRPGIGQKALCTATAKCWNGGTVTCNGNNSTTSCTAVDGNCGVTGPGHVTCDGVTTNCPTPCPCNCTALQDDCISICDPCPIIFSCNATTCVHSCRCRITRFCTGLP